MNDMLVRCTSFLRQQQYDAFLVGGTVRDMELGRESHDIDVAAPHGALQMARLLANHFGGAYYPLDAERETGRVVLPGHFVIDVALLRGADIDADLGARDFTINAMARRLTQPEILLDPHHGLPDLRLRRLRAVGDQTFEQDPARLLRAARLAAELDFAIEPHTTRLIERDAALVERVAGERVRDELLRMLQRFDADAALRRLAELGLLRHILPRAVPDGAHLAMVARVGGLASHLTCPTDAADALVRDFEKVLSNDLQSDLDGGHTNACIVKLAALYDRPADISADLGALRFRRDEIHYARTLVAAMARVRELTAPVSPLSAHRFFRDSGSTTGRMGTLVLGLAATPQGIDMAPSLDIIRALLTYYRDAYGQVIDPPPLLNGAELAERFGLRGKAIGDHLKTLVEAQVAGMIQTVADAEQYLGAATDAH
jgi:tRNA nucleotidyltransferase/poly(A) polymerase